MFFYLTDSLIVESTEKEYAAIYNAVRNLAIASENSYHMLLGTENVIEMLKGWFAQDPVLRPLVDDMANRYVYGVPSFLTYYVEVVRDNPKEMREENGCRIAQMRYTDFKETKNVQSTLLIGEDDNDCQFFKFICDWYTRNTYPGVNYSLSNTNGGGSNTYREIEKALQNRQFSLTIVDTDIRYPSQRLDRESTYGKCSKVKGQSELFKVLPLNVHEIENLIPKNYMLKLDAWDTEKLSRSKQNYESLVAEAETFLPYFDLKNGILLSKIRENVKYAAFAKKCYLQNVSLCANGLGFEDYCKKNDLEKGGKGNADSIVYRGMFSGIMARLLKKIKDGIIKEEPVLFVFQENCWKEIAQEMINWGCSRNKESLS